MNSINRHKPTRDEMDAVFALCRSNHWASCLQCVTTNPLIGTTTMIMDNHIATTVMHQAITSKGDVQARAEVILKILAGTPKAAAIKNGYGSLCLHCACQRNVKMDAKTKERVILALINAFPGSLVQEGGVGRRTPLHIVFTDYVSPTLTRVMVERGRQATFMKDKKGYLPLHVAVSRHVSPDKLTMLLQANPHSIRETTNDGKTVLNLAQATATKSHPNYALINALNVELQKPHNGSAFMPAASAPFPTRVSSNDTIDSNDSPPPKTRARAKKRKARKSSTPATKRIKQEPGLVSNMGTPAAADLLLHFSRKSNVNVAPEITIKTEPPEDFQDQATQTAEV